MAEQTETGAPLVLAVPSTMKALIEALIFASSEPVAAMQLKAMIEETSSPSEHRSLDLGEIERTVEALNKQYAASDRPYRIIVVAGGYQFATLSEYAAWISRLYRDRLRRKLSQSALETLAIIAYKQPISKPEIEQIRGVNCDYVLKALLEKELVTITGRAETVGRPLLYGTTKEFLKHFGLNSVTDLPRPREIEEILGESQFETERRMLEAQAAAEALAMKAEDFPSRLPHIPKRKPEIPEEVEIVPKKRVRQIRVRPASEAETSELPFGETPSTIPASDREIEASEVVTVSLPEAIVPAVVVEPEPQKAEASDVPPGPQPPADEGAPSPTVTDKPALAPTERSLEPTPEPAIEGSERPPKPPLAAVPADRNADHGGTPTLWKSWKEKIQTFIRKLFG